MIISFSVKGLGPTTVGVRRVLIAAAGMATLAVALYRFPIWLKAWNAGALVVAIAAAAAILVLALGVAVRGSARTVERVALEGAFFACALLAAEAILLLRAPEKWSDDPLARQLLVDERAARARGIAYDARLPTEVVRDMQAKGLDAVPGFAASNIANPAVVNAVRDRGLLPLSNAASVEVVECNEGTGYLKFRSDQFGFNNPPGLAAGPVDVAVIGASLALGHCVAPSTSAVDRVRAQFPRTANFGIAGSRVLSQLGIFREYVEPLRPSIVVWFVNVNFAEPRQEREQPVLLRYLRDASFSQGLRWRQREVDSFVREVMVPLHLQRDRALREELGGSSAFPFEQMMKLGEVRGVVNLAARREPEKPNMSDFELAVDRVAETAGQWGGRVIVVILPSYELSVRRPADVARYEAVSNALRDSAVTVVDGAALFASEPDYLRLYKLRMDNHPSELGHAVLGEAVVAAINSTEKS
jgi:hypothetical protein